MRPTDSAGLDGVGGGDRPVFGPELGELPDDADAAADEDLKTGTTTVGIRTEEAVVLATDMRASYGPMVASKDVQKIEEIHPTGAITVAGSVSAAQSLVRSLRAEVRLYEARRGEEMSMEALSTLMSNFLRSGAFFIVQPLLGGVDDEGTHLYSIGPGGSVMEEEYAVTGSGSQYAIGVLEQEYDEELGVDEARSAAVHAVDSALERDLASGNGVNIAVITDEGVEMERHKDVEALV